MTKLNQTTTKLLIKFLDQIKNVDEVDIQLRDHSPLRIERGRQIRTNEGIGTLLSIGAVHDRTKGAYAHRMEFIVLDLRGRSDKNEKVLAYPVSFQDDINQVSEVSCIIRDNKVENAIASYQRSHAKLTYTWLLDLITAGYLE